MIGKTLGHYEILEQAGAGGMGEVYRARDVRLDRIVAVKVLPSHFAENTELRQRFEREAKAISSLQHPNICTLHDIGREEGVDFLVMEFLEGETLAERLKRGPLSTDEVLRDGAEIAQALDRAHRSGIVHRDLKPGNVMLTRAGVKLVDFGLAKYATGGAGGARGAAASPSGSVPGAMTEAPRAQTPSGATTGADPTRAAQSPVSPHAPTADLTAAGTILGTFQYMAPEQLEGAEADARSDIFALGAVLYEMACGRKAFEGKSQASLIAAIMEREPAPLSSIQPMTPPALDHIVRKCLAKDPDDRWQSAQDLASQLKWVADESSRAGVPAVVSTRRKSRERLAWSLAAASAIAFVAMAALWFLNRPAPPEVTRFQIPIPEGAAFVGAPAISPDGRIIAFGVDDGSTDQIWVRPLDDLRARPLPGTEGADLAFWSPDSRHLAFFAGGKLRKVAVAGGPAQTICDAPNGDAGDWSPDGDILFDGTFNDLISRVSASGGLASAAIVRDSTDARTFGWPKFLPDAQHFLFLSIETNGFGLHWGDLETRQKQSLGAIGSQVAYVDPGYLLHVTDNTLVAQPFDATRREFAGEPIPLAEGLRVNRWGATSFTVSRTGTLVYRTQGEDQEHLAWLDRDGRELAALGDPFNYGAVALSPDGRRIAVERQDVEADNIDIWILEPARGTTSRLTFDPNQDIDPVWSPDGHHVVYAMQDESGWHVRRRAASGTGERETLETFDGFVTVTDWSDDGSYLVLTAFREERLADLLIIDVAADFEVTPYLSTQFAEFGGQLSPDNRWIAYGSNESGRDEIYVRSFPDGESKWQVSTAGGDQVQWRKDGKELFYISADRHLMSVDIEMGEQGELRIGSPGSLFEIPWVQAAFPEYTVADDGERFLWVRDVEVQDPPPFAVVLNWTAELERR